MKNDSHSRDTRLTRRPLTSDRCCSGLVHVMGVLALVALPTLGAADTVRLKSGKTIEGDVVRKDSAQIVILVGGQPQFLPTSEVDAVRYSQFKLAPPTTPAPSPAPRLEEPVRIDYTLLEWVGERLRVFHGFVKRIGRIPESLHRHDDRTAFKEARQAVQDSLPLHHGRFHPISALADLLILLGLRAPTIWLALALVRERRQFTRIAEFLVVAYGFTMLLMAVALSAPSLWIELFAFPFVWGMVALLFAWMFALEFRRALLAFLLTLGMNLGIEQLLINAHLL